MKQVGATAGGVNRGGTTGMGMVRRIAGMGLWPKVAAQAGVATEIKLDGGFLRMAGFGVAQDGLGAREGVDAAGGVGPRDPPAGPLRLAPDQRGRDGLQQKPLMLGLQDQRAQRQGLERFGFAGGQSGQFGGGFLQQAEAQIAACMGEPPSGCHDRASWRDGGRRQSRGPDSVRLRAS